jgi:hypothetical protein
MSGGAVARRAIWPNSGVPEEEQELSLAPMVSSRGPVACRSAWTPGRGAWRRRMNGLIYLIGLIVVIMAILSLLGLR